MLTLLAALLLSPAHADPVSTPVGNQEAERITAPADGSLEAVALTSLKMIRDGEFDAWMDTYCHPTKCPATARARNDLKRYNLTASQRSAAGCIHENDSLLITRRVEDSPTTQTVYFFCGSSRMPAPATFIQEDGRWQVSSFSW